MKVRGRSIVIFVLLALLLAALAGGAVVYAGIYNVAALKQHTAPVYWLLEYAMRRAVKVRADEIEAPNLADAGRIRNGFLLYRDRCQQCHGAPGVAPEALAFGLTPAPANLVGTAREWPASDIYWVVRNGIKMSGMPAWEYRLSDSEIWDIVAFVRRLPAFSPLQYRQLEASAPARPANAPDDGAVSAVAVKGDAQAGKLAISQYLCATCHRIPGITGASRDVGPPLEGIATRKYIGGVLPNTPENMIRFLQDPQAIDPLSAMPALGLRDKDARDIAAYLYTLKSVE